MINHILRITNGQHVKIIVYYRGNRSRTFREYDNLPLTVTQFILNGICKGEYKNNCKIEHFYFE